MDGDLTENCESARQPQLLLTIAISCFNRIFLLEDYHKIYQTVYKCMRCALNQWKITRVEIVVICDSDKIHRKALNGQFPGDLNWAKGLVKPIKHPTRIHYSQYSKSDR